MNAPFIQKNSETLNELVKSLYKQLGNRIVLGIPIGIGKPIAFVNALYDFAKNHPDVELSIHTGLSLGRPSTHSELEARLLEPFFDRQFQGVPELDYIKDMKHDTVPENVKVIEFYFKPGEMLTHPKAQQDFFCSNYTHVARDMMSRGVNLIGQLISKQQVDGKTEYSLASNPDVTLDLQRLMRETTAADGLPRFVVGQVNQHLPFMPNDAQVPADFFDTIIEDCNLDHRLFAAPHQPISPIDHAIGMYTSALIRDAGTLQIGIGSLGDAVVNALLVRQHQNSAYQDLAKQLKMTEHFPVVKDVGGSLPFETGLYGNTEMLVPGYLALVDGGVLKREVFDDLTIQQLVNDGFNPYELTMAWLDELIRCHKIHSELSEENLSYLQRWGILASQVKIKDQKLSLNGNSFPNDLRNIKTRQWISQSVLGTHITHPTLIHAGFFVGTEQFYNALNHMEWNKKQKINMTSVGFTNQLHRDEPLKLSQRKHARFINACMKMTLSGAAVSDGLDDGRIVSGVGGQYNFVAMAHDLPEARSILMMRSHRIEKGKAKSNIVFNYGHITIPKHLRDIVVTEYGVADLRGKTDAEVIKALIQVADAQFQPELISQAKKVGKLPDDYSAPEWAKLNTPTRLAKTVQDFAHLFRPFPFGVELTEEEITIGGALKRLKVKLQKVWPLIPALLKPISTQRTKKYAVLLDRMQLSEPRNAKERLYRKLLLSELP